MAQILNKEESGKGHTAKFLCDLPHTILREH